MENSFQTSFIPKKPIVSSPVDKAPRSLFSFIAIFIFVVSILLAGGLFAYKFYLTKQEESLSASLSKASSSFEKDTIDELSLFDKRIGTAQQILSKHIVMTPMFQLLGELTIPTIQYTTFTQQTSDSGFNVNIEGVARDYRSIALQAEEFNSAKGKYFQNILFSNLEKDKNNNIKFNLKFKVDPSLLSYESNESAKQQSVSTVSNEANVNTATPNTTDTTTTTNPLSQDLNNQTQ